VHITTTVQPIGNGLSHSVPELNTIVPEVNSPGIYTTTGTQAT